MRAWSFDKAWREVNGKVAMTSSIRGQYAALALTVLFAVATLVASSPFASARTYTIRRSIRRFRPRPLFSTYAGK